MHIDIKDDVKTRTGMGLFVCSVSDRDSGLRVTDRRFHGLMGRNDWEDTVSRNVPLRKGPLSGPAA